MEFERAQIVRALAGHDKGGYFCVLNVEGPYLFLADGKRRKAESPKRKKAKHAVCAGHCPAPLADAIRQGGNYSNSDIRRALAAFRAESRRA